jgi:hypothetical protein
MITSDRFGNTIHRKKNNKNVNKYCPKCINVGLIRVTRLDEKKETRRLFWWCIVCEYEETIKLEHFVPPIKKPEIPWVPPK